MLSRRIQNNPSRKKNNLCVLMTCSIVLLSMCIERLLFATMIGTGSPYTAGVAVGSIGALINISVRVIPETGDAVEVVAEIAWRDVDQTTWCEVIAPGIAIHGLAGRRWIGCWFRCRCRDWVSRYGRGMQCRNRRRWRCLIGVMCWCRLKGSART